MWCYFREVLLSCSVLSGFIWSKKLCIKNIKIHFAWGNLCTSTMIKRTITVMSGALSTCMSVLERHWLLVEKRTRKETGCNVLSKNVCDLSRAVLYWHLWRLRFAFGQLQNRSLCIGILCWTPWKSTGLPSDPWSTSRVVWSNILLNWMWNNMTVLVSLSFII